MCLFLLASILNDVQAQVRLLALPCWHSDSDFWLNSASHFKSDRDGLLCKSHSVCSVLVHFSIPVLSLSSSNRDYAGWRLTKLA